MGRKAGHLALGIGKSAGATLTMIPEEFPGPRVRLKAVVDTLVGAIIKRLSYDRPDGVAQRGDDERVPLPGLGPEDLPAPLRPKETTTGAEARERSLKEARERALKTLEIIAASGKTISELFEDIPKLVATPEIILTTPDNIKFSIIDEITEALQKDYEVITVDGARAEFEHGWGLVRASNTQPAITLRFEADTRPRLVEYMTRFRDLLAQDPSGRYVVTRQEKRVLLRDVLAEDVSDGAAPAPTLPPKQVETRPRDDGQPEARQPEDGPDEPEPRDTTTTEAPRQASVLWWVTQPPAPY